MGQITTAISGLVVPDGNDPINNGDDLLRALAQRIDNMLHRVGDIKFSYETADHGNWYILDGRGLATGNGGTAAAVLKSSLPSAFVAKLVGAGFEVDATHVAIPDWRGRMPVMRGTHGDIDSFTDTEGAAISSRRPAHKHSVQDSGHNHGHTDPWHSHTAGDSGHGHSLGGGGGSLAVFDSGGVTWLRPGLSGTGAYFIPMTDGYHSALGMGTDTGYANIGVNSSPTNVTNNPSTTGITVGQQTGAPTDGPAFAVANAFVFAGPLA